MKTLKFNLLSLTLCFALVACAQDAKQEEQTAEVAEASISVTDQTVEASCGMCNFGMEEAQGCELAVKIDGKNYIVDGGEAGDMHAEDGICNVVRQAKVSGEVKEGRFVATSFEMLPYEQPK